MPQALLPIIPHGATPINDVISVVREGTQWTYFCGVQPIFQHPDDDRRSFRMFTAQLCYQGACTQAQIVRSFGVSKNSVLRSVAKYRQEGTGGFYRSRRGRAASVMTAPVTAEAQRRLDRGRTRREVAEELGVRYDTLRKAIGSGRLREPTPPPAEDGSRKPTSASSPAVATDKSARSAADAAAGEQMGWPAPVLVNASWPPSACWPAGRARSSKSAGTCRTAGCFARCRRWPRTGCLTIWEPCRFCPATT